MKVLLLTNMYPTQEEPELGIFVKEQVEALSRLGAEFCIIFFDGRKNKAEYIKASIQAHKLASTKEFNLIHIHYGLAGIAVLPSFPIPSIVTFCGSDVMHPAQRRISFAGQGA